ncbi:hypothetical protein PTKU46_87180 [Paraburkholderia terrae]|uniref:Uncharacterized protein n=1 Tax=Paraburkholderia steynii TaxID=1245441 RepID=A0A7Z7FRK1_9BURK|nr:hypothetical protein [Paraburkholderia steynii]SDJ55456.1 hypothetical protein SAMN04487926_16225 [Paraburkholderia steynii]
MSDLCFSTDLHGEFDRLHRRKARIFASSPASLRAMRSETSPRLNIESTEDSIGIRAFALGRGIAPAVIGSLDGAGSPAGFLASQLHTAWQRGPCTARAVCDFSAACPCYAGHV